MITDHNQLSWLNQAAGENSKLLCWSFIGQQFDFTIQHNRSNNGKVYGLSCQEEQVEVVHVGKELAIPSMQPSNEGSCDDNEV